MVYAILCAIIFWLSILLFSTRALFKKYIRAQQAHWQSIRGNLVENLARKAYIEDLEAQLRDLGVLPVDAGMDARMRDIETQVHELSAGMNAEVAATKDPFKKIDIIRDNAGF